MLAALIAVAVAWRSLAAFDVASPWIFPDEAAYALLGRRFWEHGDLAILGGETQFFSALYPAFAGLPLELGLGFGYDLLRLLQVLVLCSTALIVYAWARSLVDPAWALAGAALSLALPGLVYGGTVTAEVLLVPLATLAAWSAVRALERPTREHQAVLVVVLTACVLTRLEAIVIALAVVIAAFVRGRLAALAPTWLAFAFATGIWIVVGAGSPLRSFGAYAPTESYTAVRVLEFVAYHAADLLLVTGVIPLCAVVLLALAPPPDSPLRSTLAVVLPLALLAVLEVGIFAAGHADRLLERELVFVLPSLLVGFVAWAGRGAVRPRLRARLVAAAAFAGLIAVPVGALATAASLPDNPSLAILIRVGGPQAYLLTALVALVGCSLFLAVPARASWLLPLAVGGTFVAVSVAAGHDFAERSQVARSVAGKAPQWIDRAVGSDVAYVYDGDPNWSVVWTQVLRNERLTRVFDLTSAVPGPLPQHQLQLPTDDGRLRLVGGGVPRTRLLVAPRGLRFDGRRLASKPSGGGAPALVLWRLDGVPRVTTWAQGLLPNGDIGRTGTATLDVYDCGRGTFTLVAVGRDNATLALSREGARVASFRIWPQGVWEQTLDTPAGAGKCTFSVSTTSLVHLERFEWVRGG